MDTPFGHSWERLGAAELRGFLADAPKDEGITWEAKCDDDRGAFQRTKFREAIAAMANGFYVGYVLVGAVWCEPDGPWSLVGLRQPPDVELTAWLDQLIDGIKPRPHVYIKRLEGDVGPAAVVQVFPLPVPPAITGGRLMVRTSGRTIALDDPGEIRRVVDRGVKALDRARMNSALAANASREIPFESPFSPSVTIGLASTGLPDDIERRIFRASFVDRLRESFVPWEVRGIRRNLHSRIAADRVAFWVEADSGSQAGALTTGASFVTYWAGADRDEGLDRAIDGLLARIWIFAGSIVSDLGGHGPTFAHVQANYPGGVAQLERSTEAPVPSSDEIDQGARHLARVRGAQDVFEPE